MNLVAPSAPTFFYGSLNGTLITRNSIDVVRGDTFAIACRSEGQPTPTYKWNGQTTENHILSVISINENHSSQKICTATNTMRDSYGATKEGSSQSTLTINVLCKYMNS